LQNVIVTMLRRVRLMVAVMLVVAAAAVATLAVAFLGRRLQWAYVAAHSRFEAPWYYRLAGVWGGSEGSFLLFVAIVGAVGTFALWRSDRETVADLRVPDARLITAWGAAAVTLAAFLAIGFGLASPFDRLDVPSVSGAGLTPILEHPAMAIHPPLLYFGLGCSFAAALCTVAGFMGSARRWLAVCAASLTVAMALGGMWSYVEQGWGGYWAWDPVENASLLVWMAALWCLHRPDTSGAWGLSPWLLALFGSTLVRSGAVPSVHSFARQETVGWTLLALATISLVAAVWWWRWNVRSTPIHVTDRQPASPDSALAHRWLMGTAAVVVLVGTLAPPLIDLFADRPAAVRGVFFARLVGPLALVAVPFLVGRLRHQRGRLAHIGIIVLLTGVGASTFDRSADVSILAGESLQAAGLTVANLGVSVVDASRGGTEAVVVDLRVDGHAMRPSLVAFPQRGGVLAETALVTRPWRDLQAVLHDATDGGAATITIRQRPLTWLLWLGALITTAGCVPRRARRGGPAGG
jgi:cytochrome c biogenesis factor